MNTTEPKVNREISSWIVSLAISVVCCSVLFIVFAGYLGDIKKSIAAENAQLTQITLNQGQLLAEIETLHRAVMAPAPQPVPAKP